MLVLLLLFPKNEDIVSGEMKEKTVCLAKIQCENNLDFFSATFVIVRIAQVSVWYGNDLVGAMYGSTLRISVYCTMEMVNITRPCHECRRIQRASVTYCTQRNEIERL